MNDVCKHPSDCMDPFPCHFTMKPGWIGVLNVCLHSTLLVEVIHFCAAEGVFTIPESPALNVYMESKEPESHGRSSLIFLAQKPFPPTTALKIWGALIAINSLTELGD